MIKLFSTVDKLKNMNPEAREILKEYLFANYDLDLNLLIDAREILKKYLIANYHLDLNRLIDVLKDFDGEDLNDINKFLAD